MGFIHAKGNLVALLAGTLFVSAIIVPPLLMEPGLDTAQPVDKFLNKALPATPPVASGGEWMVYNAFPSLEFSAPIAMVQEPGTDRMILAEHGGVMWSFDNTDEATQKTLFLDLSDRVGRQGEAGFLNFAFHPEYGHSNSYFFVFYVYRDSLTKRLYERVSRFEVLGDSGVADPTSEQVLIHQYDRQDSHNGGGFFFGTDGYLYIAVGDEGGARNPWKNAQTINDRLFGGILRVDVDQDSTRSHPIRRQPRRVDNEDFSFTANFFIPNDNPWVQADSSVLEEFYAIGLRNPHRISQDKQTGIGHIGDVGQGVWEEIDLLEKGANYQWSYKQGNADMKDPKPDSSLFIGEGRAPIHTYVHKNGDNCIIGGFVYRGQKHPELDGKYLFADNGSKKVRTLFRENDSSLVEELFAANVGGTGYQGISSFATDRSGEIYLLVFNGAGQPGGKVYKIAREQGSGFEFPRLLSQTGAFKEMQNLIPADFLIPYEPIEAFWSDGMEKKRWMVIPNDGIHNNSEEKILNSSSGWQFPTGSVFIKHFELSSAGLTGQSVRRIETRFLVNGADGKYYGITYRWLPSGEDAILLDTGLDEEISYVAEDGSMQSQIWHYPSRDECFTCHREEAGSILGARTYQLNKEIPYPLTGRTANQLHTLSSLEMLSDSLSLQEIASIQALVSSEDTTATLESRAKSYLEVNCSNCHAPGIGLRSSFDTRFETSLDSSGMIYGTLLEYVDNSTHLIVPGDTAKSAIYQRLKSLEDGISMPPLAKNVVDQKGMELIGEWIMSLEDTVATEEESVEEIEGEGTRRLSQSINFMPIANKTTEDPPFKIETQASSGLEVQVRVISGPAQWANDSLYLTGEIGRVTLELTQGGDSLYLPSESMRLSFLVQFRQTLSFPDIPDKGALDPTFELQAASTSGLEIQYEVMEGPASVLGNRLALVGVSGTVRVEARQEGTLEYAPAIPAQIEFVVHKVPLKVIFPEIGEIAVDSPPFQLQAFSEANLPVQYEVLEGPASLVGDSLFLNHEAGSITLAAWIPGDTTYRDSDTVYQTIQVSKLSQELLFPPIPDLEIFSAPYPLEAEAGSDNLIRFKVISGPVEITSENEIITKGLGRAEIEAHQEGDSMYTAASMRRSFEITKAAQEILFPQLADKLISDDPFLLNASTNSGLPISFRIESGPALLSGVALFLTGEPGKVTLVASQTGNSFYKAADPIAQTFEVIDTTQNNAEPFLTSFEPNLGQRINLKVFPNPSTDYIQVHLESDQRHPTRIFPLFVYWPRNIPRISTKRTGIFSENFYS